MKPGLPYFCLAAGCAALLLPGLARSHELRGYVAADLRYFAHASLFPEQYGRTNPSAVFAPEYFHEFKGGRDVFTFEPFLRLDPDDSQRSHADIRQLNWLHVERDWELRVGIGRVFWGVTEVQHLVDIINQTDAVEDTDGEDKLGQPMVQLSLIRDWGTLEIFALPGFRERTFPGRDGRLRSGIPVEDDDAEYESSAEDTRLDWALRWSRALGDWDIGIAQFSGTSREPRFVPRVTSGGNVELIPFYDTINQTSLDVQATLGNWLWKLEAIWRAGHGDRFYAFGFGLEYSFYGVFETDADLGIVLEYMKDDRDAQAPPNVFENDIFLGLRLALNDVQATDLLAGVVVDHVDETRFFSLEGSRRIGDRWRVELDLRVFSHVDADDLLFSLRRDDHLQLRLARFF